MENHTQPLGNILEKVVPAQQTSQTMPPAITDGIKDELMQRLRTTWTTMLQRGLVSPTGVQPSEPGALTTSNIPPNVPARMATECVTARLPWSMQLWLADMEQAYRVAGSVGLRLPDEPELTQEEREKTWREMVILDLVLQPSRSKGAELAAEIGKFLAVFPFGLKSDSSLMQAKIDGWCEALEEYPLYAVKAALDWWKKNGIREPLIADIRGDCQKMLGENIRYRKRLIERKIGKI